MWKSIKSWTAYVTCVVTASACVTVRVTCPARAYRAFVTWYLILNRLQKKWFTRARKLKVWQQKLLSWILWEAITTTKKRLSPLRIPAMVSCCWLHQNVNYNSLDKYLRLTFTQPLNLNRTTNERTPAELIVMITLFLPNLWFWAQIWNIHTTSLGLSNSTIQQISVLREDLIKPSQFSSVFPLRFFNKMK